ncbi:MAG: yicI [Candidatus Solibacter sp.]|nr:yicI [Candidatus Solibacter sp.]
MLALWMLTAPVLAAQPLTATYPPPGYTLKWSDTFQGASLDESKWMYRTDAKADSSQRPQNVSVENGSLVIHLKRENDRGKTYTGGGIISRERFRYGYYEARAKMHGGAGWHQSVWAMAATDGTTTYPSNMRTEIDGMEFDSDSPMLGHMGLIKWVGPGQSKSLTCTPGVYQAPLTFDATADFHTYGFEWTEKNIRYFLDGKLRCVLDYPPSEGEHDAINFWLTAIGYSQPGGRKVEIDNAKLPGAMVVDHAAFYEKSNEPITLSSGDTKLTIARSPVRIGVERRGTPSAGAHPESGLLLGNPDNLEPASIEGEAFDAEGHRVLTVRTPSGKQARVTVTMTPNQVDFVVRPDQPQAVLMRLAPASPGYGLGDHAAAGRAEYDTDITGYSNDHFLTGSSFTRIGSNFAIYPKQNFAFLVWDPAAKIVRSTAAECAQGSRRVESEVRFTIFTGTPREIYRQFLESRNQYGYPVLKPKYEFFGVGWEAFGALAWDTNEKTVTENVNHYLTDGYPLAWMVVGSGFWPAEDKRFHETTSFGMYDKERYPDPRRFIANFHAKGLKFFQGLRTTFITDGPFSEEGVKKDYFIQEDGRPKVFTFGWPKSPIYFLDFLKPQAVTWYADLVRKWNAYGVDGYKEDVYGYGKYPLRDDKLDPINLALMREGNYIMGRNAYLMSASDLHRINDFNYDQNQDRGPVNSLAIAYSGFPLVYPDIVGGTFGEGHFDLKVTPKMRTYMMRNAQWASLHPSMSMGQGPWTFGDPQVEKVMLAAARLHDRLQPYIYNQAIRFYTEGYPATMTPLTLAFPEDPAVYGRENQSIRGYEWMIGDALLATPLYGNDYETTNTRDVYLPRGAWIDYDSGTRYEGPRMLRDFALPPGKTPLFVGGNGIVVEKRGAALVARVYPITQQAEMVFTHPDGISRSTIRVAVADWKNARVADSNGRAQSASWERHALEFVILPGGSYELH